MILKLEDIYLKTITNIEELFQEAFKKNNELLFYEAEMFFQKKLEFYKTYAFSIKNISFMQSLKYSNLKDRKDGQVLTTSIYAIFCSLHSQNAYHKIDKKVTIGIPFIEVNFFDDMFPFFEFLESFKIIASDLEALKQSQKKIQFNSKNNFLENIVKSTAKIKETVKNHNMHLTESFPKTTQTKQGVTDEILIMEFKNLITEHEILIFEKQQQEENKNNPHSKEKKERKKKCPHCALKFEQSNMLMNIIFGDFTKYFNNYSKTDFFLLERWMNINHALPKQNNNENINGIKIIFKASQKLAISCCTQIHLPLIILTYDKGYFKNNLSLHAASAINQGKVDSFLTNVIFKPFLDVDENILLNLEDTFYQYCRLLDDRIPEYLNKEKKYSESQMFLVCYRKNILMRDLLENYDKDFRKSNNIFFLKLREIGTIFEDSSSIIPLVNLLRNVDSFSEIFSNYLKSELAYMMFLPDDFKDQENTSDILMSTMLTTQGKGEFNETHRLKILKDLEKETIYFSIDKFQFQFLNMYLEQNFQMSGSMRKPHSIIFQVNNFRLFLVAVNLRKIETLFSIDLIKLSFTSNMQFLIEKINLSKKEESFIFDIKSIKMIDRKNKNIITIPETIEMDTITKKNENQALKVTVKLLGDKLEKIEVKISSTSIELCMKTINELLEVLNVPILLSNMEHKSFKKFLKQEILHSNYKEIKYYFNLMFENVFLFKENNNNLSNLSMVKKNSTKMKRTISQIQKDPLYKKYEIEIEINKITIKLIEREVKYIY